MMLDDKTGYIKINRFSATTYDEFVQSLETLVESNQMRDIVIDLRHNPGGYLTQATKMLGQLFPEKDKLLVYTEGRTVKRTEYKTNGRTFYNIGQVVVLIDEGSASASEIVAGAIQDHDRGVIVGRRSFGKGLVQEQYPLRDGSALRLTVARYYTPSGRCIQKEYAKDDAYEADLEERYTNGELSDEDNMVIADSTRYFTTNGHVVYGGGGIIPDLFVPLDTALLNESYLTWRQYIPAFAIQYAADHPNTSGQQPFVSGFQISPALYSDFVRYAKAQGEKSAAPTANSVQTELKRFLKARLARQYFGPAAFYAVWNQSDAMIIQAQRLLKAKNPVAQARGK
jgi:carboxyl-terminal processing protease